MATSTVRYYERIGLVPAPARTQAGYRSYDADAEARLLFITRAKRLGLSLEETAELIALWDGSHCAATQGHLAGLLDAKREAITEQIEELQHLADQLAVVQGQLASSPPRETCEPDLDCCAPDLSRAEVAFAHDSDEPPLPPSMPLACTLTREERPARAVELASLGEHLVGWTRVVARSSPSTSSAEMPRSSGRSPRRTPRP